MEVSSEKVNEIIFKYSEKLLLMWVDEYKKNPRHVINCFLKFESIRMSITLITFWARHKGILSELEGQKDFSDYVNRFDLEERWKGVFSKFLLIIWGVIK